MQQDHWTESIRLRLSFISADLQARDLEVELFFLKGAPVLL